MLVSLEDSAMAATPNLVFARIPKSISVLVPKLSEWRWRQFLFLAIDQVCHRQVEIWMGPRVDGHVGSDCPEPMLCECPCPKQVTSSTDTSDETEMVSRWEIMDLLLGRSTAIFPQWRWPRGFLPLWAETRVTILCRATLECSRSCRIQHLLLKRHNLLNVLVLILILAPMSDVSYPKIGVAGLALLIRHRREPQAKLLLDLGNSEMVANQRHYSGLTVYGHEG